MLTSPKDTAPRQIDRMSLLTERAARPARSPYRTPNPGQDRRIRPPRVPWQVGGGPGSPRRRTTRSASARRFGVVVLRVEAAVLDPVVDELEHVGAGDHGHRERGQAGGPRRGDVAED